MKIKIILAIFLFGYLLEIIGVHFKIMQLQGAPEIFTASTIIKVIAVLLMIWKLVSTKSFKNILDQ